MAASSSKTKETYPNSSLTRPNKLDNVGTGDFCCIPLCKSSTLDSFGNKTKIGMFSFPKDKALHKKWLNIVSQFRRKGGKDSFSVKRTTKICEFHFEIDNIKISIGHNIKTLKTGSIPTIFSFKTKVEGPKRRSPRKRLREEHPDVFDNVEDSQIDSIDQIGCESCQEKEKELKLLKEHHENIKNENLFLKSSIAELQSKIQDTTYSYENISKDKKIFKQSTGLEVDAFEHLYELVNPGEN